MSSFSHLRPTCLDLTLILTASPTVPTKQENSLSSPRLTPKRWGSHKLGHLGRVCTKATQRWGFNISLSTFRLPRASQMQKHWINGDGCESKALIFDTESIPTPSPLLPPPSSFSISLIPSIPPCIVLTNYRPCTAFIASNVSTLQ